MFYSIVNFLKDDLNDFVSVSVMAALSQTSHADMIGQKNQVISMRAIFRMIVATQTVIKYNAFRSVLQDRRMASDLKFAEKKGWAKGSLLRCHSSREIRRRKTILSHFDNPYGAPATWRDD